MPVSGVISTGDKDNEKKRRTVSAKRTKPGFRSDRKPTRHAQCLLRAALLAEVMRNKAKLARANDEHLANAWESSAYQVGQFSDIFHN